MIPSTTGVSHGSATHKILTASSPALPGAQNEKSAKRGAEDVWPEFRARAAACYQAAWPVLVRLLRADTATRYGKNLLSAVACLDDDFEACIAHLRFPVGDRRVIRTTNLLERLFGEGRRRTKVIPPALVGASPFPYHQGIGIAA